MIPKWLYYGVHNDPHLRLWLPGMVTTKNEAITPDLIEACTPPVTVEPFEVRVTALPFGTALAFRERWKTQLSPDSVPALFITSDQVENNSDALLAAAAAFPQVWPRFEKLRISETCTYTPPSSAPSVSSTSETVSQSEPAKPSAKSSA